MNKRNNSFNRKLFSIFMLPVVILIWMTGWILLSTSSSKISLTTFPQKQMPIIASREKFQQQFNEPAIQA
jgi:CHASE3 domain sensor protein